LGRSESPLGWLSIGDPRDGYRQRKTSPAIVPAVCDVQFAAHLARRVSASVKPETVSFILGCESMVEDLFQMAWIDARAVVLDFEGQSLCGEADACHQRGLWLVEFSECLTCIVDQVYKDLENFVAIDID
jgi:hypothetical protein